MNRNTLLILTLLLLAGGSSQGADITKAGTTAAKFLAIGAGSRAVAMGGAFVATADDASAMYWNVAGLAQLQRPELLVNHTRWLADINYTYMGLVLPMGSLGTFGLNVLAMTMDEMRATDLGVEGDYTGATFNVGSYAVGVAFARQLTNRFAIGGNFKYINETISQASASGIALDIGTIFLTPFRDIRLGVSVSNFGTKMQMTGDALLVLKDIAPNEAGNNESVNAVLATGKFDLPLLLRVGLAKDLVQNDRLWLTAEVDAMHPNDNTEYINAGLELGLRLVGGEVALRGGVKSLGLEQTDEEYTLGAGVMLPLRGMDLSADYAYESWSRLGMIQKFTLRLGF